ncbi:MAG: ABC transporter ATP-binding protein [Ruminococcus sp.]|jgi:ABC-type nitrate/sulfonate/bicarbonate transport system ATPase subunit
MQMEQARKIEKNFITLEHVDKEFEKVKEGGVFKVVKDLNISVRENEFLVLFGPGQCGKTTILNMIAGFEEPTAGKISMKGEEIHGPDPSRGMVFQNLAIFPWLTVMGNVEYGLRMKGVDKKTRREKAQYYIDLVGLKGFENHYPIQISGGMKQRVGIARAYCNEPDVILMDEPFGALDAQTRYLMQDEIIRIWEAEKKTIIFVTNNIEEAVYVADRIVVIRNCPTNVKAEYEISLPRPRSYIDPDFLEMRREINSVVDHTL